MAEDKHITNLRVDKFNVGGLANNWTMWQTATFTVTAEATDVGIVDIQLKDGEGNNLTNTALVDVYISTTAGGAEASTGPNGAVAVSDTGTLVNTITAKKYYRFLSNSSGAFNISITESGAKTFYVNIVQPATGTIMSSAAMTWT